MTRWGKWTILTVAGAGVVALVLAGRVALSQQAATSAGTPPPSMLAWLFGKARPHVEDALGAKLDFAPQFRAVTAGDLLATPDEDLDAHLRWRFPVLEGQTLARTRQIARQIVGSATVARYVEGAEVIVVALDNLPKIAAWDEALGPVNSDAFLQLALVHEVVRWHLDRRFQLAKLRAGCHDAEEWDALQAVIQGRAQAVTRAVASKLGNEALFPLLAKRYLCVPDEAPDASLKTVSQTFLHGRYRAGMQGMAFFDGLARAGLRDPEGLVFSRPPRQMTVIAQPQRWVEAFNKKQPDLAAALQPLECTLPAAEWQQVQQTWTPSMLVQVASLLGAPQERVDKIAKTWYEGRSLIWVQRKNADRQLALTVVRHNDDGGARAQFGLMVDLDRKQDVLPASTCGTTLRVVDSKFSAVQMAGFDETMRNDKLIAFGTGAAIPVSQLLARAGNLVIECTWHGPTADPALAERLVQAVRTGAK